MKQKGLHSPEEFAHEHHKGMNLSYWMLVTLKKEEIESIYNIMEEYAKHYHNETN